MSSWRSVRSPETLPTEPSDPSWSVSRIRIPVSKLGSSSPISGNAFLPMTILFNASTLTIFALRTSTLTNSKVTHFLLFFILSIQFLFGYSENRANIYRYICVCVFFAFSFPFFCLVTKKTELKEHNGHQDMFCLFGSVLFIIKTSSLILVTYSEHALLSFIFFSSFGFLIDQSLCVKVRCFFFFKKKKNHLGLVRFPR